jgi:hypothetical protein
MKESAGGEWTGQTLHCSLLTADSTFTRSSAMYSIIL